MSGRKRTQPRAAKRSLTEEMKMARLNGTSLAAQMRWAINDAKRMRVAAAKALGDVMFAEMPQAPVIDSAQVGRTPPIEPDPCSITHHDHLPASSLLPPRAQDDSVAGMMELAASSHQLVPLVAVSDGPSSSSEYSQNLNDSPPDSPRPSHRRPIAVDEQPPAFLSGKVGEQAGEIILLEERVEALDSQIKTRDEQISALVSSNTLLCAQKQTLQSKIARVNREVKKEQEEVKAAAENDKDLRRVIVVKNRELSKHSEHLHTIVLEHSERLAVFARRTSFAENQLELRVAHDKGVAEQREKHDLEHVDRLANYGRRTALAEAKLAKMEAAWPEGVPMPRVGPNEFVRYGGRGQPFTPRVVYMHPPLGQIADVD